MIENNKLIIASTKKSNYLFAIHILKSQIDIHSFILKFSINNNSKSFKFQTAISIFPTFFIFPHSSVFPLQCAFFDDVNKSGQEECYKEQNCCKTVPSQFPEINGIWIKKDDFHIKKHKQYGD